ncbi:GNAT family N-acetyltransferase [Oscillatoria sp. FACHB-1407]|uniref:GNAT family N-acetyltransferase n=1 Tax=Oscillatoria sp. FACHB-1407 TaxID=2692847 RepID=UPI001687C0CE|nr:GNAT family N-acetyltransferase [Oscillatoria sp. FACHB-1407]MBD2462451.1 GNAT family N-acetyltransferase [Oscillatoria sp. FACHB-1407]
MQLHRFDSVQEFWQQVQAYLVQYEAEHNALLGIVQTLLHFPERYPEPPYLATVQVNDEIVAIALRTPPGHLLLSKAQDSDALKLIAQDVQYDPLSGVSSLVAEADAFVKMWQTLTGQACHCEMESRIYQLTQVKPVGRASGSLRLATEGDRPLLLDWFTAFNVAIDGVVPNDIERRVDVELKRQSTYLWENETPVAMVGGRPFSPTAARIAPVYTPPKHRRKGYATACVAAVSQMLLDQGCKSCFLFTDLANPTSNRIYQQIGYRPVCDWHEYAFIH